MIISSNESFPIKYKEDTLDKSINIKEKNNSLDNSLIK